MINTQLNDCVVVIDSNNRISQVLPSESIFSKYLDCDFSSLIIKDKELLDKRFNPLVDEKQVVINQSLMIRLEDTVYTCQYNGIKDGQFIYLFILFNQSTDIEIMKKMMIMNSQQVNQIRDLQKRVQNQDFKVYEEISKLNSDLVNSKRLIEKQNAELNRYNALLSQMAREDSLTGCFNRRYFNEYVKEHYLVSLKDQTHSLSLIDFNAFKEVNDQLGHDAGDRLLIEFVSLTQKMLTQIGEIFRIGGDEFVIIFNNTQEKVAHRYMKDISELFGNLSPIASISYGIVSFNECEINHEFDITKLMRKADQLLYEHKKSIKSKT